MTATLTAHNDVNRLYAQFPDPPPPWTGVDGPLTEKLWALVSIAEAVENSERRSGELVGCVYAASGGCDGEKLAEAILMRCTHCVNETREAMR